MLAGGEQNASLFPQTLASIWQGAGNPRADGDNPVALMPNYEGYVPIPAITEGRQAGETQAGPVPEETSA